MANLITKTPTLIRKDLTEWWIPGETFVWLDKTFIVSKQERSIKKVVYSYGGITYECIFETPGICNNYKDFEQYIVMEGNDPNLINHHTGLSQEKRRDQRQSDLQDRQNKREELNKQMEELFGEWETYKEDGDTKERTKIRG